MLNFIYNDTMKFIDLKTKLERKKIGQFFTEVSIAKFMANKIDYNKESIKVLDAGAGSGILAAAICIRSLEENIKNIEIDLYENNSCIIPLLKTNMELVKNTLYNEGVNFKYNIIEKNFILDNEQNWKDKDRYFGKYDIAISNPPYKKIGKKDKESIVMEDIVYGQPNIYFLFMAMATKLLRNSGQLIFINPRSFTSGAYFSKFREWFVENIKITDIHLFANRENVFKSDKVLQETIILKAVKTDEIINTINITTSSNSEFNDTQRLKAPISKVINNNMGNNYILIPSNKEELEIIKLINSWTHIMPELGFKLSTGKVIDFRAMDLIKPNKSDDAVPLIRASHFINNEINHPIEDEKIIQYVSNNNDSRGILNENKNYLLIKRFTSKEETKRIQCAIYLKDNFKEYDSIGFENHINYINGDLGKEELYGLFVIFNSTYMDKYYRILNGSTQVNATEMNSIPLPDIKIIRELGKNILKSLDLTVNKCDKLIQEFFLNKGEQKWVS